MGLPGPEGIHEVLAPAEDGVGVAGRRVDPPRYQVELPPGGAKMSPEAVCLVTGI